MSSTKSAVIGSTGVEVLNFEVKADNDASDLTVDEIKVKGVVVDNSSVTTVAQVDTITTTGTDTGTDGNGEVLTVTVTDA